MTYHFSTFTTSFLREVETAVEKLRLSYGHDDNEIAELHFLINGPGTALIWNEETSGFDTFFWNGEAWVDQTALGRSQQEQARALKERTER